MMMTSGTGASSGRGGARGGRVARAFTLLELLVAVTIIASVSTLLAALWAQTHRWAAENGSSLRTMRLPRAQEFLRAQWADRRGSFRLTDSGESVAAEPGRLSFVTASPALFPDWPVVRASIIVERDFETPAGAPPAWKLVYEETKLADLESPPKEAESLIAEGGGELVRRQTLLGGLARLDFERFGVGDRSRQKQGSLTDESAPAPRPSAAGARGGNDEAEGEEGLIGPIGEEERREEDTKRWRGFTQRFRGEMPAVRVVGEYEGEPFSCLFVIAGSR